MRCERRIVLTNTFYFKMVKRVLNIKAARQCALIYINIHNSENYTTQHIPSDHSVFHKIAKHDSKGYYLHYVECVFARTRTRTYT